MISHNELKKGTIFLLDGQPCECLESFPVKTAQRRAVIQSRIKNLITGAVLEKTFHQGDVFEEADMTKVEIKFLYTHKDRSVFCEKDNPSKRFELTKEQIGENAKYLKNNEIVEGLVFDEKIITISLPIKVQLKVIEAPPGIKGERAQAGTKSVKLETNAEINVPLFVEEGDIIEINTETNEYVKRV